MTVMDSLFVYPASRPKSLGTCHLIPQWTRAFVKWFLLVRTKPSSQRRCDCSEVIPLSNKEGRCPTAARACQSTYARAQRSHSCKRFDQFWRERSVICILKYFMYICIINKFMTPCQNKSYALQFVEGLLNIIRLQTMIEYVIVLY